MRVLITGSAGFIGSHLAERLGHAGHEVVGVDNLLTGRHDNWPSTIILDITDRQKLYAVANTVEPELVVHCAASYSDPDLWHRDTQTNVEGTINAALVAKHHGSRLFYFQTALPPFSSYAISKHAGEHYIRLSGVDALTFRLANVYGPRNVSGPVPAFWKRLRNGEPCKVADTVREMVFVDDLVEAVMLAVDRPEVDGTVDICSGSPVRIDSVYHAVAAAVGFSHPDTEYLPRADDDVFGMILDPAAAAERLGWDSTMPLTAGVAAAVQWYDRHGVEQAYTHLREKG